MPKVRTDIPEVHHSIARPVAEQVVGQILRNLRLSDKVPIRFIGLSTALPITESTIGKGNEADLRLPADTAIEVTLEEEYEPDTQRTMQTFDASERHIFRDPTTRTDLRVAYQQIRNNVTIRFKGTDRTVVSSLLKRYRSKISQSQTEFTHYINYHYPLPPVYIELLAHIHALREKQAGYDDTIGEYLFKNFHQSMTVVANQAGKGKMIAIKEKGGQVVTWYSGGDEQPRQENGNGSGNWIAELNITYIYDRPETCIISYPLMVHNSIIARDYWPNLDPYTPEDDYLKASERQWALNYFTYTFRGAERGNGIKGVSDPRFDDFIENYEYPGYQTILRQLIAISPTDRKSLTNLTDLGEWKLTDAAIEYLKSNFDKVNKIGYSLFYLNVFRWENLLDPTKITVDSDLNVSYSEDLDLRDLHHVTISLATDPTQLEDEVWNDIRCNYDLLKEYFGAFGETYVDLLDNLTGHTNEDGEFCVSLADIEQVVTEISKDVNTRGIDYKSMKTVGIFSIIAHRGGDL